MNNYKLDANSRSSDYAVPIVPEMSATRNIFGGTLGGPIIKDRLFFFADYSGNRYHSGGVALASVIDQKMRQGDFSELLDPQIMCAGTCSGNHKTIQLYDPANGFAPFVNNQVPLTNPVAIFLYSHANVYPLPNQAPSLYSPVANDYVGPTKSRIYNNQFDVRIDYKLSDKHSFFGSYSQSVAGNTQTSSLLITFPGASTYPTRGFSVNSIHTFTPNLLNEFRIWLHCSALKN